MKAMKAPETQQKFKDGPVGFLVLRASGVPTMGRALGLWRAEHAAGMQAIVTSLPLDAWMRTQTTPLTPHPSDPAITHQAS